MSTCGGQPYQHKTYLGDAVSEWRDKLRIRSDLRLYDARATAATRILEAGAELKERDAHGLALEACGQGD